MPDTLRVVLLMDSGAGYDRGVLRGIARYARHYGSWVFLPYWEQRRLSRTSPLRLNTLAPRLERGRRRSTSMTHEMERLGVTGVVGRLSSPEIVEAVLALNLSAIGMDLSDEQRADNHIASRISEIRPDSQKVGRMAADHLLERGFRRFAFCGHPDNPNWSCQRCAGFCERLREADFSCDIYQPPKSRSPLFWDREHPAMISWLQSLQKPVGIMACNDERGRHVIEACALGKMHVPNDVAVVGVDEDQLLSELSNPPLSSIALNGEQGGYQAAELLHRMMLGEVKEPQHLLVEPLWVVPRLSTDVIAIEDRDIANTVRYIRENARRPIQISDIVEHSGISRRALEIRFQRSLGWSIREEIERVRMGLAKQLLAETDLPIGKVAENTGFSGEDYMSKVFRRVTKTTPVKYRREHWST